MTWKIIALIPLFYFLALLQSGFFAHFSFFGFTPGLILIAVVLIGLFSADLFLGLAAALVGGFFWDVFSNQPFGYHVLILLVSVAFIHFIFKKYVRYPFS